MNLKPLLSVGCDCSVVAEPLRLLGALRFDLLSHYFHPLPSDLCWQWCYCVDALMDAEPKPTSRFKNDC